MRILVVEDEESIRTILCELLEGEGHQTFRAKTVEEATTLVGAAKPRVVLLDLLMNGELSTPLIKVINEMMRDNLPHIFIISAMSKAENVAESSGVGFLKKPFDLDDLHGILKDAERQEKANVRPPDRKDDRNPHEMVCQ